MIRAEEGGVLISPILGEGVVHREHRGGGRGWQAVCEEYIKDLNRELGEVTELIKKEIVE